MPVMSPGIPPIYGLFSGCDPAKAGYRCWRRYAYRCGRQGGQTRRQTLQVDRQRWPFVQITASGSKLWRMRYEYARREKLLSFGPYRASA